MADVVDKATRSRMMSGIRGKDTKPEMLVRSFLHSAGLRYRLHLKGLPGKPDIVLRRHRAVIFVHGCFWHGHQCAVFKWPKTREAFWRDKIIRNRERDICAIRELQALGWRVCVIWECALRSKAGLDAVLQRVCRWIRGARQFREEY